MGVCWSNLFFVVVVVAVFWFSEFLQALSFEQGLPLVFFKSTVTRLVGGWTIVVVDVVLIL